MINTYSRLFDNIKLNPVVEFYNGDFLEHDWSNASVIFSNSICFNASIKKTIIKKLEKLREGVYFITTCRFFPNNSDLFWDQLFSFKSKLSWGGAQVFIFQKTM